MKKLTELQTHMLDQAHSYMSTVLHELRAKPLRGQELKRMKLLKASVQHLEAVKIKTAVRARKR